jgi:hypothetical protein
MHIYVPFQCHTLYNVGIIVNIFQCTIHGNFYFFFYCQYYSCFYIASGLHNNPKDWVSSPEHACDGYQNRGIQGTTRDLDTVPHEKTLACGLAPAHRLWVHQQWQSSIK